MIPTNSTPHNNNNTLVPPESYLAFGIVASLSTVVYTQARKAFPGITTEQQIPLYLGKCWESIKWGVDHLNIGKFLIKLLPCPTL